MKRQRPSFAPEFKLEAASLVLDQGYSVSEACKSLDVGETALRRWVDQLRDERGGKTPTSKAMTEEQQRIQGLEKRVRELETEKRILKKATALLMSDEFKPLIHRCYYMKKPDELLHQVLKAIPSVSENFDSSSRASQGQVPISESVQVEKFNQATR